MPWGPRRKPALASRAGGLRIYRVVPHFVHAGIKTGQRNAECLDSIIVAVHEAVFAPDVCIGFGKILNA